MSIEVPFYTRQLRGMLEIIIEKKRKKMIALAKKYGLSAQETVQVSKELDQLIIIYQKNLIS